MDSKKKLLPFNQSRVLLLSIIASSFPICTLILINKILCLNILFTEFFQVPLLNDYTLNITRSFLNFNSSNINIYDHLLNIFISGLFYGITLLAILSTIFTYSTFRIKKLTVFIYLSTFILLSFIYCDLAIYTSYTISIAGFFIRSCIIISLLFIILIKLSQYCPFRYKRKIKLHETTLYSVISIIAIFAYFITRLMHKEKLLILDLILLIFLIITQLLIKKYNKKNNYSVYTLLLISLIVFYSLCFTNIPRDTNIELFILNNSNLKIISMLCMIFILLNNYKIIIYQNDKSKKNRIFVYQYMFLVKNYHKLLQKEKNNLPQNNNSNQIIISENIDSQDLIRKQYKLTDREVEVLKLVWNGLSNKEIAQELNITISTTKYHISNIFIKLNVSSRTQLFSLKN